MLLATVFLLALSTTFCSQMLPLEVEAMFEKLDGMERKLMLIRRAQEEQQWKLITVERKLNYMLSRMMHLVHAKPAKEELCESFRMALERLENKTTKWEQQLNKKLQLNLEQRDEQNDKLAEISELLKQLGAKSQQMSKEKQLFDPVYMQPAKSDCFELDDEQQPRIDGVYKFLEPELNELRRDFNERYCAFATDGPAWTVIQQRSNSNSSWENFHRNWDEYRTGFGHLSKDFWFGNQFIHRIVYRDDYVLRIELQDHNGTKTWSEYGLFRLDSEIYNYQLVIGEWHENSTATDALTSHNQMEFRVSSEQNGECDSSGWWFDQCLQIKSNLNGHHIIWNNYHNEYSLNGSRMLIRPRNLNPVKDTDNSYDDFGY